MYEATYLNWYTIYELFKAFDGDLVLKCELLGRKIYDDNQPSENQLKFFI